MIYERPGPRYKYVVRPQRTITKSDGTIEHQIGVYAHFTGYPPRFDSEKEAKRVTGVERQMGQLEFGSDKAFNTKVKWWNEQLIKFIEKNEDYEVDPLVSQRIGRIQRKIQDRDRLMLGGYYITPKIVCKYCEEIKVFENFQQLQDHLTELHADALLDDLTKSKAKHDQSTDQNENTTEA